jgi:hypothetical protein
VSRKGTSSEPPLEQDAWSSGGSVTFGRIDTPPEERTQRSKLTAKSAEVE